MNLASAYPNSDLSALAMTVMAVVMTCTLAVWLILVFLADRQPRRRAEAGQAEADTAAAGPAAVADNNLSELGEHQTAEQQHGVAA
jgi:hypothetical protein